MFSWICVLFGCGGWYVGFLKVVFVFFVCGPGTIYSFWSGVMVFFSEVTEILTSLIGVLCGLVVFQVCFWTVWLVHIMRWACMSWQLESPSITNGGLGYFGSLSVVSWLASMASSLLCSIASSFLFPGNLLQRLFLCFGFLCYSFNFLAFLSASFALAFRFLVFLDGFVVFLF